MNKIYYNEDGVFLSGDRIIMEYVEPSPEYKLYVDINASTTNYTPYSASTWTFNGETLTKTWNHWSGFTISTSPWIASPLQLKYSDNTLSNYIITLLTGFTYGYNNGKSTGNNTGVYPDICMVWNGVWYVDGVTSIATIELSGLETGKTYNFTFFGSRENWDTTTRYTITGGTSKDGTYVDNSINNNTTVTSTISNIQPSSTGKIRVQIWSQYFGAFAVLEINENG